MASNFKKLKFCANISTLFDDRRVRVRMSKAKEKGFKAIEAHFLYDDDEFALRSIVKKTGLEVVLIDSPSCGDFPGFNDRIFGMACVPGLEVEFLKSIKKAIAYANLMNCKKVHVIGGLDLDGVDEIDLFLKYVDSMKIAVEMLEEHNIMTLIKPLCSEDMPNYYLDSYDKAVHVISAVSSPNIKLLLNTYQMHKLGMNVERGIRKYLQYAGHVQVAQSPNRNEPFAPGDIDYTRVFQVLAEEKYNGYVGLEYKASGPEAFDWLQE